MRSNGEHRAGAGVCQLSNDECVALEAYTARATWPAGFLVYERGTSADGIFVVVHGSVVLRSRGRAGRGFVPCIAICGQTFGSEGLTPHGLYSTEARADEAQTETLFMSSVRLRAFVREQPVHALALVGQAMAERTTLLEKLREITTLSVEQRIMKALQQFAAHRAFLDDTGRIELGNSRYRLLCEMVGATRESVALVLNRLVGEGIVERVDSTLYVVPSALCFERIDSRSDGLLVAGSTGADAALQ